MADDLNAKNKADEVKYVVSFCGGTERFWQGIPARDLTAEEWALVDDELQKTVIEIGLYELIDAPAPVKTLKKKETEGEQ